MRAVNIASARLIYKNTELIPIEFSFFVLALTFVRQILQEYI